MTHLIYRLLLLLLTFRYRWNLIAVFRCCKIMVLLEFSLLSCVMENWMSFFGLWWCHYRVIIVSFVDCQLGYMFPSQKVSTWCCSSCNNHIFLMTQCIEFFIKLSMTLICDTVSYWIWAVVDGSTEIWISSKAL